MAEIQQWRRKIPTARSRTPLPDALEVDTESRPATASGAYPALPPTPKRGLRPKLSSYLSQGPFGSSAKPSDVEHVLEGSQLDFPSWPVRESFPSPDPERLIDSIMCRILSDPYDALDPRFNGTLLHIFEAFRNAADGRDRLQVQLDEEVASRSSDKGIMQYAEAKWRDERQAYRAEVKRLELIISKGKRGVADVALARQDSIIRNGKTSTNPELGEGDDGKETVLEFLEKTKRYEDPAWSGQRATMKPRESSPSAKLVRLSRKLTEKASSTSLGAALPLVSHPAEMPSAQAFPPLGEGPQIDSYAAKSTVGPHADVEQPTSLSDDTDSTFSCAGDLLPEEVDERTMPESGRQYASTTNDEAELQQMALAVSRPRGISEESVLPKIMQLFTNHDNSHRQASRGALGTTSSAPVITRKPSQLMGFINKLKPQLALDTASPGRRFSFESSDDTGPLPPPPSSTAASRGSLLRTSVSLPALPNMATELPQVVEHDSTSPAKTSPAKSSTTVDSRRLSKIPSPSFPGVLAKPRGSGSRSSSIYSTRSTIRLGAEHYDGSADLSSLEAARLQVADHSNVLRSGAAAAAAIAASNASLRSSRGQNPSQHKHWHMQSTTLDRSRPEEQYVESLPADAAKENRPLRSHPGQVTDVGDPASAPCLVDTALQGSY